MFNQSRSTRWKPKSQPKKPYPIADVWTAIAYADRINQGQYVNDRTVFAQDEPRKNTNRSLALAVLTSIVTADQIQDADREFGIVLAEHFSGLVFHTLKQAGAGANELVGRASFTDTIASIIGMSEVGTYEVACMVCLPSTYRKDLKKEARAETMFALNATSEYVGMPGSKHEIPVDIISTVYSQKYEALIVTAKSGGNIVKFFTSKDRGEFPDNSTIKIKGTVKHASVNDRTGGKETWLTRVKVIS
jgi:hypothetical protein